MATLVRFSSPAGKVLAQLRDGPKTVDELATALRITPNAVRNQLRKLQDWKLAARSGSRPTASKPSAVYSITLDGEIQFSTIYLPVLSQFLRVAEGRCSGRQLDTWMRETGRTLGRRFPHPEGNKRERIEAATQLLRSFGGLPEVRRVDGHMVIQSKACPLAALTSEHPAACKILESLLAEYLEMSVRSCCVTGSDPSCCFNVKT
jgi:predicted ArsR family transcriptional regulator